MFWRQLPEKYSHSGLVWSALRHFLSEYGDLLCKSAYSVQMLEKIYTRKKLQKRTLSTVVRLCSSQIKFVFVSTLRDKFIFVI